MKFLTWKQPMGLAECPYAERWILNFGIFTIRLHHWMKSDDLRHHHNHPWWFITWVVKGHYEDIIPGDTPTNGTIRVLEHVDGIETRSSYNYTSNLNTEAMTTGKIRYRPANHTHKVKVLRSTWTLLLTGPNVHKWGFFVNGKFKKANKYFFEEGHHPCEDGDAPVRTPTPK